ncbi:hypothetical protein MKX03_011410 [Papaver bracteatum]|nr:hypothetical protein MKX03_011410 [Papaver bracteatum]
MEKRSLGCTMFIQFTLCFALFLIFNSGGSQKSANNSKKMTSRDMMLDLYFLSVRGGTRSIKEQNHLLNQGTLHFPSLNVSWYTTNASQGRKKEKLENKYFLKKVHLWNGKMLDIIVLDTKSLQEYFCTGEPVSIGSHQLNWLTRTLEMSNSNCFQNAYLSKQGCTKTSHATEGSIAYIGNMGPTDKILKYADSNGSSRLISEVENGFVLHKVSLLKLVSYFINSAGFAISRYTLVQRGIEVM